MIEIKVLRQIERESLWKWLRRVETLIVKPSPMFSSQIGTANLASEGVSGSVWGLKC